MIFNMPKVVETEDNVEDIQVADIDLREVIHARVPGHVQTIDLLHSGK